MLGEVIILSIDKFEQYKRKKHKLVKMLLI